MSDPHCWGIFRERAHSPGREYDDSEILTLTGKELEARGFQVTLKSPEEALSSPEPRPVGVFMMCERIPILQRLHAVEGRGVPHVNSPRAVLNTYRDRMITQFQEANVPFVPSHFVSTVDGHGVGALPVWVKRPDVHNTQDGDVVFGDTAERVGQALADLAARGIDRAVIQPHVAGDLVKFYGVGVGIGAAGAPPWFRWFYHKDQRLHEYAFDAATLARTVRQAATALGLEIYGGDAVITPTGAIVLLDLNAWPSFALYREEAAPRIADYLARRFAAVSR